MRRSRNCDQVGIAADRLLGDGREPRADDVVIGAAGAEAERGRGGAGFELGGERGQLVQQLAIGAEALGAAHRIGDLAELLLDPLHRGRDALGLGQAQERQRAVGLDLQEPLHQRAGAVGLEPAIDHQDADEAVLVRLEVGGDGGGTLDHLAARQTRAVEPLLGRDPAALVDQMQIERDQQRPRLRHGGHDVRNRTGRGLERNGAGRRQLPGIGRELGVVLPAQRGAAECAAVMLGRGRGRHDAVADAEGRQRRALGLRRRGVDQETEMQDAPRGLERRERPRVQLAEHGGAQRMIRERPAAHRDVRTLHGTGLPLLRYPSICCSKCAVILRWPRVARPSKDGGAVTLRGSRPSVARTSG